jgi:acid phosphatase class B
MSFISRDMKLYFLFLFMKSLVQYIEESIKSLSKDVSGIIVFDIDDTLLKANPKVISVYKKEPGKREQKLTTDEFAKDEDAKDPSKRSWFDYRDFNDPVKVYDSIVSGTPIIKNLRIMDSYIKAGYDFCFLTARSCEDVVKSALDSFLRIKDNGTLSELGDVFKKSLSHAVNDKIRNYPGATDAEKKANILKELSRKYDRVVFVDDDRKNVKAARDLGLKNLKVVQAHKV